MRCAACGQLLADGSRYCPSCGAKIDEQQINQEAEVKEEQAAEYESAPENSYTIYNQPYTHYVDQPMKWYKFLIYVSLILSGTLNIVGGVINIMGGIGWMKTGTPDGLSAAVTEVYGPLTIMNMIFGVLFIAQGVYAMIVRQKLAGYRKGAPKHLLMLYVITFIMNGIYQIAAAMITGQSVLQIADITSMVMAVIMVVANKVYFDKREHLFDQ